MFVKLSNICIIMLNVWSAIMENKQIFSCESWHQEILFPCWYICGCWMTCTITWSLPFLMKYILGSLQKVPALYFIDYISGQMCGTDNWPAHFYWKTRQKVKQFKLKFGKTLNNHVLYIEMHQSLWIFSLPPIWIIVKKSLWCSIHSKNTFW